jgi:transposase
MDRYIGLDAHKETCTLAVMGPSGKRIKERVVETNVRLLIEEIRSIAGTRHLCMEEGAQSAWLYETLEPHVDELVVVQPEKRQGSKSDSIDAWVLAEQMRTRRFGTRVFKAPRRFTRLRQAVRAHRVAVREMVRAKNRLKAQYRSRGVRELSNEVYEAEKRTNWLRKLTGPHRTIGELMSFQLDAAMQAHERAEKWLLDEAKLVPEVARLDTVPGLGPIRASQIVAVVVTPDRFRTKRQFWSYCGLGIVTRSSSDWTKDRSTGELVRRSKSQTRGLTRNRNALLKEVFKGAAEHVIVMKNQPLRADYERMVAAGTEPKLAVLTIARRIASATLAIWKHKEDYAPEKHVAKTAA